MNPLVAYIFFITLISLTAVKADTLSCREVLNNVQSSRDENINTLPSLVRRPVTGNTINPNGLEKWIAAHAEFGGEYLELANFIAENLKLFTQKQFEEFLTSSLTKFLDDLNEQEQYYIVVAEEPNKSQNWVAKLVKELSPLNPPQNIIINPSSKELDDYISRHPEQKILFVDDATYMGQGIIDGLNTVFQKQRLRANKSLLFSKNTPIQVNVVVAAAATEAIKDFQRHIGLKLYYSHHMPSFEELLDGVTDPQRRERLSNAFENQYGDFAKYLMLTGFAHKTADHASVVGMSADEDYSQALPIGPLNRDFNPRVDDHGATVFEGVLLGPDNLYRQTIPIMNAEDKPYGD